MLSLKNMIKPEQSAEIDFPGFPDFVVTLNYLGRDKLSEIRSKCVQRKIVRGQVDESLDFEMFNKLYSRSVIKGWKGLKLSYLSKLMLVDLPADYKEDDELEFTEENAEALLRHATDFDAFVTNTLADLGNFTKRG